MKSHGHIVSGAPTLQGQGLRWRWRRSVSSEGCLAPTVIGPKAVLQEGSFARALDTAGSADEHRLRMLLLAAAAPGAAVLVAPTHGRRSRSARRRCGGLL